MSAGMDRECWTPSAALTGRQFIHIPGPNPILRPAPAEAWDDRLLESCDMLHDHDTYYLYYHATSHRTGYQIGVVTARHPLGPFRRSVPGPLLALGPAGSWDDQGVACALVLKEGADRYWMWYSGLSSEPGATWGIGLASASRPEGPWTKHEANPIVPDFGYVGGVVLADGVYHLYTEHRIGSRGPDYGPLSLATAPAPEGPWTPHTQPILQPGEWGEWDDGGFSEAKVFRQDGVFHLFYGGARLHPSRLQTQESIGYACSLDGRTFTKHLTNPVISRENCPDTSALAEVHACSEPPFVYLYHTLRTWSEPGAEYLGVQVLATEQPFCLTIPVLESETLGAGESTTVDDCPPISLGRAQTCTLTVTGRFAEGARAGAAVRVLASTDGLAYDTENWCACTLPGRPGQTVQASCAVPAGPNFVKCLVQNLDLTDAISGLQVTATVRG